ncbi:MAG TPA: MFS transporter [Candidatus Saccharimonadales bacterium]|nr:MFS transporter [Candidatus Saccharimonadales bacterium]
MDRHKDNAKWLIRFAPFRVLSVSGAYITPFFIQHGMSLWQIFALQTIYSVAALAWEIPGGLIADKWGRAFAIKLSAPISGVMLVLYGLSSHYWQFALCELALAIGNGLYNGVDTALLADSLAAEGRSDQFTKLSQRIDAMGYAATALGVPAAFLLVKFVSINATIVADGLLTLIGMAFVYRLVEAPPLAAHEMLDARKSVWGAIKGMAGNVEARWLVALGSILSASTYMSFWLSTPYFVNLGIPAVAFGAILAFRCLVKVAMLHFVKQTKHLERNMAAYTALAGLTYLAMATKLLWLAPSVLGHDAVQALHAAPIKAALNQHIESRYRATLNSAVSVIQRLLYAVAGPFIGLLADKRGLPFAFIATGIACSLLACIALARLHRLKTFQERS